MTTPIGEQIRVAREARSMSQATLGERVGVSERTIWAIENEGHIARRRVMERIRIELDLVGDEEETRVQWPIRAQVVATAVADLLSAMPEKDRHDWADDLTLRVINDDARIAHRNDWPSDVQIIANMVGAYLTRED